MVKLWNNGDIESNLSEPSLVSEIGANEWGSFDGFGRIQALDLRLVVLGEIMVDLWYAWDSEESFFRIYDTGIQQTIVFLSVSQISLQILSGILSFPD